MCLKELYFDKYLLKTLFKKKLVRLMLLKLVKFDKMIAYSCVRLDHFHMEVPKLDT